MSKPFALILALTMLSQSLSALWVAAGFYANRDFIAKNQCENRFILNSSCKGQCVLMKKLKEQQEKEQHQPDLKLKETVLFLQMAEFTNTTSLPNFEYATRYSPQRESLYVFRMSHTIFHPPIS